MIREASVSDIPDLLDMHRACHASAGSGVFDADAARNGIANLISGAESVVLRSEGGMIGGFLLRQWDAPSWLMAVEMVWWAEDKQWLPLLRRFGDWAGKMGAAEVRIASMAQEQSARIDGALAREGYALRELFYGKVI